MKKLSNKKEVLTFVRERFPVPDKLEESEPASIILPDCFFEAGCEDASLSDKARFYYALLQGKVISASNTVIKYNKLILIGGISIFPDWVAQFSFGFYSLMLTSILIGLIVMIFFKPRTWCAFCPMATMTQAICKLRNRKIGK